MIPLMKSAFLNEEQTKEALAKFILQAPRLSMSEKCLEFEKVFSEYQQTKHCVLFNSGGSANLALLQALKNLDRLRTGARVGFSALTWSTNVMPIIQMGFQPIAVDCEPKTLNVMSATLLSRLAEADLDALFITNALGFSGDLDTIKDICEKKRIILIEDNCEALGTELPAGRTGNFGLASSFSFFVAHHMSTIEGGMLCTNDSELSEMLRIVRANGWDRNLSSYQQEKIRKKHSIKSEFESKYTFYDLGFNLRPTEITGFLGLFQLQFIEENIKIRENNYIRFKEVSDDNPELISLECSHLSRVSSFALPVLCKTLDLKSKYQQIFVSAGIEIRPMIAGNIQKQPFYSRYVKKLYDLPGTDFIHDCGFYCGNYPDLSKADLDIIEGCLHA